MNGGYRNRRHALAIALAEKFERNARMIEKTVWQNEKILPLTFLFTYKMAGYMEKQKKLMCQMRTFRFRPRIRCQEKLCFPLQSLGTAPQNRFL